MTSTLHLSPSFAVLVSVNTAARRISVTAPASQAKPSLRLRRPPVTAKLPLGRQRVALQTKLGRRPRHRWDPAASYIDDKFESSINGH